MRAYGWAVGALAVFGCGDCPKGDIVVECGTGGDAFEPLTDGMTVTMVSGPQGGWHLWVSVELSNTDQNVKILPTITFPELDDLKISSSIETSVGLAYEPDTCAGSYTGLEARLDPTAIAPDAQQVICQLAGKTLHLRVDVTDLDGDHGGSCERDVVVALDPVDVPDCS